MTAAPVFFSSAAAFGEWLAAHAATAPELIVGFHKRATGRACMTWSEAVDEALCVGWIDGVRTRIDDETYKIRFTPRRPGSIWSAINIAKVEALRAAGRMTPAGLAAYERRSAAKSVIYSYEQAETASLTADEEKRFRRERAAWRFFEAQPPGWRHQMLHRIASAKRAATREARLAKLIAACAAGVRMP